MQNFIVADTKFYRTIEYIADSKLKSTLPLGIIVHPLRNAEKRINDVALLILQEDPPYTDFIRPICIPDHTFTSTLRSIFVAGWGSTARNTDALVLSNIKLYARLNHINHTTCLRYGYRYSEVCR